MTAKLFSMHYPAPAGLKTTEGSVTLKDAARLLGRKGGQSKSEMKKAASRENGKKGGRPKKEKPAGVITVSAGKRGRGRNYWPGL
jgi:hypothetical protein